MGNNESDKKVMWYEVYHELAMELAKLDTKESQKEFYEKCMNDDEFREQHNWTKVLEDKGHWIKNTLEGRIKWGVHHGEKEDNQYPVERFDPMQIFASFNGFGMKEESRIRKIDIYFRLLGSEKRYSEEEKEIRLLKKLKSFNWSMLEKKLSLKDFNYQWIEFCRKSINFTGCPSPMMLALVFMREPKQIDILWKAFRNAMKSKKEANDDKEDKINFEEIKKCHGVSVEIFTVLLFWIDSRNFLPLDKNTLALFETNNNKIKYDTWEEYIAFLTEKDRPRPTDTYRVIACMSWKCTNELSDYKDDLAKFGITKCPTKSLKIIAINPLGGCNPKFLKGLKENQIYLFDKAYTITIDDKMKIKKVEYSKENDIQIFNQKNLDININAIVGENGTGKSTLVELLLAVINNIIFKTYECKKKSKIKIIEITGLKIELIFEDLHIYKVKINDDKVELFKYDDSKWIEIKNLKNKQFFYNILVNYSIHSLDSSENNWIDPHFDNDCYTDIVIEPFREKGNINIQKEEKSVKQRLITNLLEPELEEDDYSFRKLTKTYKAIFIQGENKKINGNIQEDFRFFLDKNYIEKDGKRLYDIEKLSIEKSRIENNENIVSLDKYIKNSTFEDIVLENNIKLSDLSSGEKQKIYSINSILYHIQRLDKKKYKHINLILDEIELYFHPELQRTYINDIIKAIKKVGTENILGINITFITHSPFILSDIPESKILFLDKESKDIKAKTVPKDNGIQTFGANIHTLLSDSFFMSNGLMGEFAKNKIRTIKVAHRYIFKHEKKLLTTEFYDKGKRLIIENLPKFWQIQEIIGEPFLQKIVKNQLEEIELILFGRDEAIDNEIARLLALKASMK